ncbi:hypothetical protein [Lederbergia lenta]|uniref:hypothetical protein n=1 Tax=Lederbergia lenta TaxID=1467 RepID=UPI00203D9F3A|nr:hypothetical protein [Lederbergia lenta]MCM3111681.1 hypothetical protein [Lederbergia lenta]
MSNEKCNHKWIDLEDGTLDRFCVKCRKFAMQAMAMPSKIESTLPNGLPTASEKIEVPFYNGSEHMRMTVYKDDVLKQMSKELGIPDALMNGLRR